MLNGKPLARDVPFKEVQVTSLGDSASADAAEVAALNVGLRHAGWVVESIRSTSISLVLQRAASSMAICKTDDHVGHRRWRCSGKGGGS